MKILIIDNYDSFTYNLVHMVEKITNEYPTVVRNDEISIDEINSMLNIELKDLQVALIEMELLNELQQHHDGKFSISFI